MKGDKMKEITFIFNGLGYGSHYQADVFIYDKNNLIYEGKTYNGSISINLQKHRKYKLMAKFFNSYLTYCFYVDKDMKYKLSFNHSIIDLSRTNSITFLLTDYYYDNLPIERGELILWPRM